MTNKQIYTVVLISALTFLVAAFWINYSLMSHVPNDPYLPSNLEVVEVDEIKGIALVCAGEYNCFHVPYTEE